MAQQVKDPALPKLWHRSQLWLRFSPWPGNFHIATGIEEKKKKKESTSKNIKHETKLTRLLDPFWGTMREKAALSSQ